MAKKPATPKQPRPEPEPEPPRAAPLDRIVDAALRLAVTRHWSDIPLAEIGREAGVSMTELYTAAPCKSAILEALSRRVDAAMLAGAADSADETPRDRLFEAVMGRLDALAPVKPGLVGLARDLRRGHVAVLCSGLHFARSMRWTLEAAGIPVAGVKGAMRVQVLGALYLSVLQVWLGDDSEDQARTMAVLDRRLRAAGRWLGLRDAAEPEVASSAA